MCMLFYCHNPFCIAGKDAMTNCVGYFNKSASNASKLLEKERLVRKAGSKEEDTAMTLKDIQRRATAVFKKI